MFQNQIPEKYDILHTGKIHQQSGEFSSRTEKKEEI